MSGLTRAGRGLWSVALLSAAVIPVFLQVAATHRAYWTGNVAGPFWETAVGPWSARVWGVMGVLALAGWASSAAPPGAPTVAARLARGGLVAGLGASVWLAASAPSLSWLTRLGVEGVLGTYALAFAPVLAAALVAGVGGAWREGPAAAALGGIAGGAALWGLA